MFEVDAESLYEAVAFAIAEFRAGEIKIDAPGPMTEFRVTVLRKPIRAPDPSEAGHEVGEAEHEGRAGGNFEEAETAGGLGCAARRARSIWAASRKPKAARRTGPTESFLSSVIVVWTLTLQ